MDLDEYLTQLASSDPTPGGGSAACLTGALAASLIAMVARITLASPRHGAVAAAATALIAEADALRARLRSAQADDERAYAAVVAAQTLPRSSEAEKAARTAAVQAALAGAAAAPLDAAGLALDAARLARRAGELGNTHLASDVECAVRFAGAAFAASAANVRINHAYLRDADLVRAQRERLRDLGDALHEATAAALAEIAAA